MWSFAFSFPVVCVIEISVVVLYESVFVSFSITWSLPSTKKVTAWFHRLNNNNNNTAQNVARIHYSKHIHAHTYTQAPHARVYWLYTTLNWQQTGTEAGEDSSAKWRRKKWKKKYIEIRSEWVQKGFLSERKGKVIPCRWTENRKGAGTNSGY